MNQITTPSRHELRTASDETIEDAVKHADLMMLRGLVYQLTGDPELKALPIGRNRLGYAEFPTPANDEAVALVRRKAADFLKQYRDSGAGDIGVGPAERLPESLRMIVDEPITDEDMPYYIEELALDPWIRCIKWQKQPTPKQLQDFSITIIGAGLGGLNTALQLKKAGLPYTMIEKNPDVGGTWYENRYPGARLDTPSRGYTHLVGTDFGYPYNFCPSSENKKYLDWIADHFDLRRNITFNTEVTALTWNEKDALWEIDTVGPQGKKKLKSRAVLTAVGFLNRPNIPDFPGMKDFKGHSWHTARWPADVEWRGKRIAVIGTGATGYQMIPELALEAGHVTVFQRTAQWVFPRPGYRSPFPPQVNWLDRNFPFHTNFMRFRTMYRSPALAALTTIDPDFKDPHTRSAASKALRDSVMAFMHSKISDPKLIADMTPPHPPLSARPVQVDPDYSILDAVVRDNCTLVTSGIKRITETGIEDAAGRHHDVDIIVYATGFRPNDFLYPMTVTGRNGQTLTDLWSKEGGRAYLGCMMPGFPNLWVGLGPNTNGFLHLAGFHELTTLYAMRCLERAMNEGKRAVEVKPEPYVRYNQMMDQANSTKIWADPRVHTYYWTQFNRSVVMNPIESPAMWRFLKEPKWEDLVVE